MNMSIFDIPEIEEIIISYLDKIIDFTRLRLTNKSYHKLLTNDYTCENFKSFSKKDLTNEEKFRYACKNGFFSVAKYIYYKYDNVDIRAYYDNAFRLACSNGHLDIAQWLYKLDGNPDFERNFTAYERYTYGNCVFDLTRKHKHWHVLRWLIEIAIDIIGYQTAFTAACADNQLDLAKQLLKSCKNIDYNRGIKVACTAGHLDVIKWLFSWDESLKISTDYPNFLGYACANGHLDVAKWLFEIGKTITVDSFMVACHYGHLDVAKWLYEIIGENVKQVDISHLFRLIFENKLICEKNRLSMAKWLFEIDNNIDVRLDIGHIFYETCRKGHLDTAKWLLKSWPDIDINTQNSVFFWYSCKYDNLNIAKWLFGLSNNDSSSGFFSKWSPKSSNIFMNEASIKETCSVSEDVNVMKWLYEMNTFDMNKFCVSLFVIACNYGRLDTAKWLYSFDKVGIDNIINDKLMYDVCFSYKKNVAVWLYQIKENFDVHVNDNFLFRHVCDKGVIKMIKFLVSKETQPGIFKKLAKEILESGTYYKISFHVPLNYRNEGQNRVFALLQKIANS